MNLYMVLYTVNGEFDEFPRGYILIFGQPFRRSSSSTGPRYLVGHSQGAASLSYFLFDALMRYLAMVNWWLNISG